MGRGRPGRGDRRGGAPGAHDRPEESDVHRFSRAVAEALAGPDPAAVPGDLCRVCVELLDVTGASVSLSDGSGAAILWWSSDDTAGSLAEAQYSLGDGPCRSALDLVAPVMAADLSSGEDAARWPVFAQRAVELGVRAVFSLPLGGDVLAIGTLDLYRRAPGTLSPRDQVLAFPASDAIGYSLIRLHAADQQQPRAHPAGQPASWLDAAEDDREQVHHATGMVMVQLETGPQQALARLRAYAFTHGLTVTEVAREVVEHRVRFDPDGEQA